MRKILLAAASGLLASLLIGAVSASAEETDVQETTLHLNRFIVTDSGNRVLTGSCDADQITQTGWYVSDDDSLYYYYNDGSCAQEETTLDDDILICSPRTAHCGQAGRRSRESVIIMTQRSAHRCSAG